MESTPPIEGHLKTRYSDNELLEFKELIENKLAHARSELHDLQDQLKRMSEDTEEKMVGQESGSSTL